MSISDAMLLLLLVTVLSRSLTFPNVKAVAFSTAPYDGAVNPYSNYTCPIQCVCYRVNEITNRPTASVNCTVDYISPQMTTLISEISNPLTGYALFSCVYSGRYEKESPPDSTLWDGAFQRVTHLRALVCDHCRFRKLSKNGLRGLVSLTELTIRDAAIDDLDPDLLAYLPQLDVLEISNSALTHLFPLCSVGALRVLNISGNHFVSLEDPGLRCSEGYVSRLETLDVSSNYLTEMPHWLGYSVPNLYHLRLASNHISQTEDSPFQNLHKLTSLDISNNSFTSFHYKFFRGCSNLHLLYMSMNKVSALSRGLLANLSSLQQFEISGMNLDDQVWEEISDLRQLIHLNMSKNRLTSLNADVMSQFLRIENLDLSNNKIIHIPIEAFEYQTHLNTLDLSFNELQDIPSHAFRNQYAVKCLNLGHNKITTIGYDAFSQLKELITFDLSFNLISSLPSKTFHGLSKVTHFDLSRNNLTVIDSEDFLKNVQISYLNISHNNLIEVAALNQLPKLKIIDLSCNRIAYLSPLFLSDLRELSTVLLSHNELKALPMKLFKGCESVKIIDLSYNAVQLLDDAIFSSTSRVQIVDLSHNEITDISTVFSGLKDLEKLDLSFNRIDKVLRGQFPHFIKHLNLRGNQVAFITAHTFKSLSRIQTVDLSNNKLTSLNRMDVEIAFNMPYVPLFNLEYNPFVCDCNLGWLKDWSMNKLKDTMTVPTFNLNSGLGCRSPFYNDLQTLQKLSRSEFLCSYTSHCEESCMCCDYACYCKYVCPTSCHCYIGDDYLQIHQVLCNSANLTSVPSELPEGATNLRLDGNNIQVLKRHDFLALKHAENLYLNNSRITSIQNDTFKGLKSVRRLYLNNNRLTTVYSVTFQGLDSLEELFLQNNDLPSIDAQAFLLPPMLHLANLQNNAFSFIHLEEWLLFANRTSTSRTKAKIYLSGNPWSCNADFFCKFLSFVQINKEFVPDVSKVGCIHHTIEENPLALHTDSSLLLDLQPEQCGINQSSHGNMTWQKLRASSSHSETYALIGACVVIIFAFILLIAVYVNRQLLQVLFFTRFGFRIFRKTTSLEDADRPYDAFISYSNKDEDFVIQQLAPRLENGDKKFKLCVHYRDFPVGVSITETIVRSVEASKKTILVVSDNFLDSEWCRFEFQTAHQQVLTERRNRVILILMHNLEQEKLDDALKVYIRTRTYLKYDDPWFWEKLIFAMPDTSHRKSHMPSPLPSSRDLEYLEQERHLSVHHQYPRFQTLRGVIQCDNAQESHVSRHQKYPRFQTLGDGIQCDMVQESHHSEEHEYPGFQTLLNGRQCDTLHNYMYEIPVFESPNVQYHLAHNVCCSTHTNCAYHNSDGSDNTSTSCYHNGSIRGSCCHYEQVGPGSSSAQSTPRRQAGSPPPVPLIPKEGFIPREKFMTIKV